MTVFDIDNPSDDSVPSIFNNPDPVVVRPDVQLKDDEIVKDDLLPTDENVTDIVDKEEATASSSNFAVIVGIMIALIVVIVLVLLIVYFVRQSRKIQKFAAEAEPIP